MLSVSDRSMNEYESTCIVAMHPLQECYVKRIFMQLLNKVV